MNEKRQYLKRITIEVGEDMHQDIKVRAVNKKMTMKEWVYLSLRETIRRERLEEKT